MAEDIAFASEEVLAGDLIRPIGLAGADIDGDGDDDVVATFNGSDHIVWLENTNGQGTETRRHVISDQLIEPRWVQCRDLDADGDLDIIVNSVSLDDGFLYWYENLDGAGGFGPGHQIGDSGLAFQGLDIVDIDEDGDLDVLSTSANLALYFENTDGQGAFADEQILLQTDHNLQNIYAMELDGDETMEFVLSTGLEDESASVYVVQQTQNGFALSQSFSFDGYPMKIVQGDLDQDGDQDFAATLFSSQAGIGLVWFMQENDSTLFTLQDPIVNGSDWGGRGLLALDTDNNGTYELVASFLNTGTAAWQEELRRYHYDEESTAFVGEVLAEDFRSNPISLELADLDGDGYKDFLAASQYKGVGWFKNPGTENSTAHYSTLTPYLGQQPELLVTDLEADGHVDIVAVTLGGTTLHNYLPSGIEYHSHLFSSSGENPGLTLFEEAQTPHLVYAASGAVAIMEYDAIQRTFVLEQELVSDFETRHTELIDLDDDGDLDIIGWEHVDHDWDWAGGAAHLFMMSDSLQGYEPALYLGFDDVYDIVCGDFDDDGDMDIVKAGTWQLSFMENNGEGEFSADSIDSSIAAPGALATVDIDLDGDLDLVVGSTERPNSYYGTLAWIENRISSDGGWVVNELHTHLPRYSVDTPDLDQDGDPDILTSSGSDVLWHENLDGNGTFSEARFIRDVPWSHYCYAVSTGDINGDGLLDVIAMIEEGYESSILWFENQGAVSVEDYGTSFRQPQSMALLSVYPNPFNPQTLIRLELVQPAIAEVGVYNLAGQLVRTVHHGNLPKGTTELVFDGSALGSGMYVVQAETKYQVVREKVLLLK